MEKQKPVTRKGDCHQWSSKGSCSRDPCPYNHDPKKRHRSPKGKGKIEGETPRPLIPADALHHQRKRNALISKKATVLRERNAYTRVRLRADSFLKVNAKMAKTVNSHTLSPNALLQEETLLTAPIGQLGMKQRGEPSSKAKSKAKKRGKRRIRCKNSLWLGWSNANNRRTIHVIFRQCGISL